MNVLVTYADEKYDNAKSKLIKSAKKFNVFDKIFSFGPQDIDSEFRTLNQDILKIKRGNGLWLWKPYFVYKVLEKLNDGDTLFYCDAGAFFLFNPKKILNRIDNIYAVDIPLIEKQFTKNDVFDFMGSTEEDKNSNQIIATYFIIRKNDFTVNFVKEWLNLCCCKEIIEPSDMKREFNYFISHREDQSIFSLLCKKYKIKPHRDISQRAILPYTYWARGYIFRKSRYLDNRAIILYLHKMPIVNNKIIINHFLRQIRNNTLGIILSKIERRKYNSVWKYKTNNSSNRL